MPTGTLLLSHVSRHLEYLSSFAPSTPQIKLRVSTPIPENRDVAHCGSSHVPHGVFACISLRTSIHRFPPFLMSLCLTTCAVTTSLLTRLSVEGENSAWGELVSSFYATTMHGMPGDLLAGGVFYFSLSKTWL
jgi:hypothetical protein